MGKRKDLFLSSPRIDPMNTFIKSSYILETYSGLTKFNRILLIRLTGVTILEINFTGGYYFDISSFHTKPITLPLIRSVSINLLDGAWLVRRESVAIKAD